MKTLFLLVFSMLVVTLSCQQEQPVNLEEEKSNVQSVFNQYSTAWNNLDIEQFAKIFSKNENMVIFDGQNKFIGWGAWKDRLLKSFEEIENVNVSFYEHKINVYPKCNLAYLSAYEDATWLSEEQPDTVKGVRITWVLEKTNGNWAIVHGHWSIPTEF
jgi:uncharacterized protein (TIGR02246 family)